MRLISMSVAVSAMVLASSAVATAEPMEGQLDVGAYPTTPSPPLGIAGTMEAGARLEGQRLAAFVVGPWEVDPALSEGFLNGAVVIDGPGALQGDMPAQLAEVGVRHNVIDGFATGRRAEDKDLRITVLRFADPGVAGAAATDFAAAAAKGVDSDGPVTEISVPGHPETKAFSHPYVDELHGPTTRVRSFTAHGPYVVVQRSAAVAGADDAALLVAGTLDRQGPLIDQFQPLPPEQLAGQPLDPTGLLARALPVDPAQVTGALPGVYDARATLHFEDDPIAAAGMLAEAGVANWLNGPVSVHQARDLQGAQIIIDDLADAATEYATPADPVVGIPGSRCMTLQVPGVDDDWNYCLAVADRYALETYGDTLVEARQKIAAQSAILMHP